MSVANISLNTVTKPIIIFKDIQGISGLTGEDSQLSKMISTEVCGRYNDPHRWTCFRGGSSCVCVAHWHTFYQAPSGSLSCRNMNNSSSGHLSLWPQCDTYLIRAAGVKMVAGVWEEFERRYCIKWTSKENGKVVNSESTVREMIWKLIKCE